MGNLSGSAEEGLEDMDREVEVPTGVRWRRLGRESLEGHEWLVVQRRVVHLVANCLVLEQ